MIGVDSESAYEVHRSTIPAGHSLHLFSDGVFEIVTADGGRGTLTDFLPLLMQPANPPTTEPERIYQSIRAMARSGPFDDDFSLLVLTFP